MSMFCYQCEQTAKGQGCTVAGVCGKDADTAALQDLLVHGLKGLSMYAHRARKLGSSDPELDRFTQQALFSTITNVNFDPQRLAGLLDQLEENRGRARSMYLEACRAQGIDPEQLNGPAAIELGGNNAQRIAHAASINIARRAERLGDDLTGLQELLTYGLKGMAAYADHACILGHEDARVYEFVHRALDYLAGQEQSVDQLLALNLECGEVNLLAMELLDAANTGAYGDPEPTSVRITPVKGKAILVSGHDLKDLDALLQQTAGAGINVYTHGEMLPTNGYPGLKRHAHLIGNYGGAWQDQQREFEQFPGPILMTTNCIQKPKPSYFDRIFTCGLVAWPEVRHIADRDFSPLIQAALAAQGFSEDQPEKRIMVGFGHAALLGAADKVIEAVKSGALRHIFLIGGCDGAKSGRNYYTQLAQAVPKDCLIMTLACGKFRFNKLEFGEIDGLPRLLDVGQCNDAYSAVKVASALAEAFDTDVNGLPLSLVLSWYEQKAVCILLSLLHLGIKGIRLGPTLPAFVTPGVFKVLQDKFGIMPIGDPHDDLSRMLEHE
ncbi:MAG: hydroxylamine reductase [Candidatus Alcyoniella australis]|nr:hydroxylamine reductase [Candidatus Alcyoniella australis]